MSDNIKQRCKIHFKRIHFIILFLFFIFRCIVTSNQLHIYIRLLIYLGRIRYNEKKTKKNKNVALHFSRNCIEFSIEISKMKWRKKRNRNFFGFSASLVSFRKAKIVNTKHRKQPTMNALVFLIIKKSFK